MKETPKIKTKIGSRIRITSVPFGIKNLSVGIEGEMIEAPEIINDFVQVRIRLDDGRIINWKESNLEVVEAPGEAVQIETKSNKEARGDQISTEDTEEKQKEIELIQREGKLFARVKELRRHPLNQQIYGHNNVKARLEEIKLTGWIETLTITPSGLIISGNTRHECAEILGWKIVRVEVREFATEREETKALLLYNSSREKTKEELCREAMVWEEIEKEEAAIRRRQTQNNKSNVDEGSDWANLPSQTEKPNKGRASQDAAEKVGLKRKNYEKMKKVVTAIDCLKDRGRNNAARNLSKILNGKSTDAAYKQIEQLNKVESAIESLKKTNQNDAADILEDILKNHSIKDGIEQMKTWESDHKRRTNNFQHLDVVRIKSEEHRGEWGILDVYDSDKLTGVVMTVLGEVQVQLVNLEKISLGDRDKKAAYDLMIRLQRLSYQLQGKNEPLAHQMLQEIARKKEPALNNLEEVYLLTTEVFLTGSIERFRAKVVEFLRI